MNLQKEIAKYEAVIFDLGGVIIDIDYHATVAAFKQLNCENFDALFSQATQTSLFDDYEIGKVSSQYFINELKKLIGVHASPNELVHAWNAMIGEFSVTKINFLNELKSSHKTAFLSNTNELHEDYAKRKLKQISNQNLESLVDCCFLSHQIGMRKPNPDIFKFACDKLQVLPQNTLFIDDSIQHIESAKKTGLNVLLFKQNDSF